MVVEMTSLQGVMGRDYALASGEDEDVAIAIQDHYSSTPRSKAGLAIGIADKLDSLAGLFAAGLAPTGNKDPFAQRRAALGIVESLTEWDVDFDLSAALKVAAEQLPLTLSDEDFKACEEFIMARLRVILLDEGYRHDVVDAVLAAQHNNPAGVKRTVIALSNAMAQDNWDALLPAYARCVRITRSQEKTFAADKSALVEQVEKDLFEQTQKAIASEINSVEGFVEAFTPLIDPINSFFDQVLVMAEDEKLKEARLGLLQEIASMLDGIADLSKVEGF
jgi:glycyl-tRNA synthetase